MEAKETYYRKRDPLKYQSLSLSLSLSLPFSLTLLLSRKRNLL